MNWSSKRFIAVLSIFGVLLGQGCTKGPSAEAVKLSKRVVMNVWGVVDDVDAYQDVFTDFRKSHPNVELRFKRFRLEEYEQELLNALAEDKGPDLFMVHASAVDKYLSKILPMPKTAKTAVQVVTGTLKKEVTFQVVSQPLLSLKSLKNDFADVVAKNSIRSVNVSLKPEEEKIMEDRVVALPLYVDTLALYYNKDLLNAAGISTPPEDWGQFQAQVRKLVKQDETGKIVQAGAGLGTGKNVERAFDILSLLMMQNLAEMTDADGSPTFTRLPSALEGQREEPPAVQALSFYTDFANPAKDVYTWNAEQPNSLDAFIQGTSAFFLGYNYQLPLIRARAPKLNLGIAKAPQIGTPSVNYANYWMWTVSKKTAVPDLSWLLVNQMAGKDGADKFLKIAKRPAALKSLLDGQLEDEDVGVFASQVLTAKTWYRGINSKAAEDAFIELIDSAIGAEPEAMSEALRLAQEKVAQTVR